MPNLFWYFSVLLLILPKWFQLLPLLMKQSPPFFTFYLNFECDGCLGKATSYKNTNHSYVSDAVVKRQYIIKGLVFLRLASLRLCHTSLEFHQVLWFTNCWILLLKLQQTKTFGFQLKPRHSLAFYVASSRFSTLVIWSEVSLHGLGFPNQEHRA